MYKLTIFIYKIQKIDDRTSQQLTKQSISWSRRSCCTVHSALQFIAKHVHTNVCFLQQLCSVKVNNKYTQPLGYAYKRCIITKPLDCMDVAPVANTAVSKRVNKSSRKM